jgi:hypothetical protein
MDPETGARVDAKPRWSTWGLIAGAALLAAGGLWYAPGPLGWVLLPLSQNPGTFHRERYTQVVEHVRALGLQPGEKRWLRLADLRDPASLSAAPPDKILARGQGAGSVWARRTAAGTLQVVIETRDLGHAGEYGFAYSDLPLRPSGDPGGWMHLDLPGPLTIIRPEMQIDDRWWSVLYNLD